MNFSGCKFTCLSKTCWGWNLDWCIFRRGVSPKFQPRQDTLKQSDFDRPSNHQGLAQTTGLWRDHGTLESNQALEFTYNIHFFSMSNGTKINVMEFSFLNSQYTPRFSMSVYWEKGLWYDSILVNIIKKTTHLVISPYNFFHAINSV